MSLTFPIFLGCEHCETVISTLQLGETEAQNSLVHLAQPGLKPSSIPWGAKGCPECRGKLTKSNLSDPNPFHPIRQRAGQHREGHKMFLASSCSQRCFLVLCFICPSKRKEYTCRVCFGLCLWVNATANCKWSN